VSRPVFRLSPGGDVGSIGVELLSLSRHNMEPDVLSFRKRRGIGPTLEFGDAVSLTRNGELIFSGRCQSPMVIDDRWDQVQVLGPWWSLERVRAVRVAGEQLTSLIQLAVAADGSPMTRAATVSALIAAGGFGPISEGLGESVYPAGVWVRDSSLAECVRLMMDPSLDGYVVSDLSGSPTLRFGRYRDRTPVVIAAGSYPVIGWTGGLREDLNLSGLVVTRRADDDPVDSQGAGGDPAVPVYVRGSVGSAALADASVLQVDGGVDDPSLPERSGWCADVWTDSQLGNTSLALTMVGPDHPTPGTVIRLSGESLRYNVQSTSWDLRSNQVSVQCGPPRRLGVNRLADVAVQVRREEPGQSRYGPRRVRVRDPYEPFVRGGVLYFEPGAVNGVITKWQDIALNAVPPPSQAGITGETVFAAFLLVKAEVTFEDLWITAATVTGSEIVITSGAQPPDVNTGFIDGAISCEFHAPLAAMEDGRRISRTIRSSLTVRIVQTAPGVAGLRSERA